MATAPAGDTFSFHFTPAYRAAGWCFGVRPGTTEVTITARSLAVRFGPWRVQTSVDNIEDVAVTGPYAFLKTAGPAHLGLTDRGLTFATNGERGVRLSFRESITGIEPTGRIHHPELTLTVADPDGFAAHLRELTSPGSPS
jgi:hypothetical protein